MQSIKQLIETSGMEVGPIPNTFVCLGDLCVCYYYLFVLAMLVGVWMSLGSRQPAAHNS